VTAISKGAPRTWVVCGTTVTIARSASPYGTLKTTMGRVLAVAPRSNNQTSPRQGCILFLVEEAEERLAGLSNLAIRKRPGIERQVPSPSQDFHSNSLLVADRKRVESIQKIERLLAHRYRLAAVGGLGKHGGSVLMLRRPQKRYLPVMRAESSADIAGADGADLHGLAPERIMPFTHT
jgi:hypothetical protein